MQSVYEKCDILWGHVKNQSSQAKCQSAMLILPLITVKSTSLPHPRLNKICVVYVTWYSELSWYFPRRPILIFSYSHFLFKPHQRHYNASITQLTGGHMGKYNFQICLVKFTLGTIYFKIAATRGTEQLLYSLLLLCLCVLRGSAG